MYKCCECGVFFKDEEADFRSSVLEDSVRPWDKIMVCPVCGSDDIDSASECQFCGEPANDTASGLCPDCETEVNDKFREMLDYFADKWDVSVETAEEEILNLLCL